MRALKLVALIQTITCLTYYASADSTVFVSQSPDGITTTSLLKAVEDPRVTAIVIDGSSYTLGHEFDSFIGTGVPITRNVTVSGAQGLDTTLDLGFVRSAVELCSTCRWTFTNITVANDRRGTGAHADFFLGQPGSALLYENALKLRPACTTAAETAVVVNQTKRSKYLPAADAPQRYTVINTTHKGVLYQDQLHLIDYTVDNPKVAQEGRGIMGGTAVRDINTTRLCRFEADGDCLKTKSSDTCVNEKVDQVLAEQEAAQAGQAGAGASSQKVAIAAGVASAGVVLVAAIGLGLLWRHRKRQHELQDTKAISVTRSGGSAYGSGNDFDVEKGRGSSYMVAATAAGRASAPDSCISDEGPRGRGWEIISVLTTPVMRGQQADKIKLGELLGAGSFGRVYKAIWAGKEVAVKVIEHDTASTAAVENEVQMMLSFNHPNIVRAFHCITYTKQHTSSTCGSRRNAHSSHNLASVTGPASFTAQNSSMKPDQRPTDSANSNNNIMQQQEGAISQDNRAAAVAEVEKTAVTVEDVTTDRSAAGDQAAAAAESSPAGLTGSVPAPDTNSTALLSAAGGGDRYRGSAGSWTSLNMTQSSSGSCRDGSGGQFHIQGAARAETWLVQEYCNMGTLSSVLAQWSSEEKSEECMRHLLLLLLDAAQGLQMLHNQHAVHADLNGRNVLVATSAVSPIGMVAKLADLGLSRIIKQHKTHHTTQTVGTMSHMPPELLRYGRMSPAVDVYAFGIMMWEAFTGQAAFKKLHYGQFYEAIVLQNLRPLMPANMPADYRLLMEHCWATNPADRPSIDRVVECLKFMVAERQASPPSTAGSADSTCGARSRAVQLPNMLNTPPAPHRKGIAAAAAAAAAAANVAGTQSAHAGSHGSRLAYDDGGIVDLGGVGEADGDGGCDAFDALSGCMPAKVPGELTLLPQPIGHDNPLWFV